MVPHQGLALYRRISENLREGRLTEEDRAELQRLVSAIDRATHLLSVALDLKTHFEEED